MSDLSGQLCEVLAAAFGTAEDLTPAPDQPPHILLPRLELPALWTPSPTRALTIWGAWPEQRPEFLVDPSLVGETGEAPQSSSAVLRLGETWREFSFSFAWKGDDPVRVVQLWLHRFIENT